MQKITTYLWFDDQAEEAMVTLELAGRRFLALDGGPRFRFTEAISLYVDCASQEEVDELWARLTEGGEESERGWLKDRWGLSWQIVPRVLPELLTDPDPAKAQRVMKANGHAEDRHPGVEGGRRALLTRPGRPPWRGRAWRVSTAARPSPEGRPRGRGPQAEAVSSFVSPVLRRSSASIASTDSPALSRRYSRTE
ncbi:VOC family protein [Nonomuraea longispora]|uniref:VOC family protein n=1 Tax=Nonomuraea longispora TaxID=1848320 RepID=UPI001FEA6B64|nr:VOC family protein [Nonomuraea longispora]